MCPRFVFHRLEFLHAPHAVSERRDVHQHGAGQLHVRVPARILGHQLRDGGRRLLAPALPEWWNLQGRNTIIKAQNSEEFWRTTRNRNVRGRSRNWCSSSDMWGTEGAFEMRFFNSSRRTIAATFQRVQMKIRHMHPKMK